MNAGGLMQVWMLIICLFSVSARAAEFQHIKLHPDFEQYLSDGQLKSSPIQTQGLKTQHSLHSGLGEKIREVLLGQNGNFTNPTESEGEESLLYQEIRRHLEAAHQEIGAKQVTQLNAINQQFNLGNQNFSGFSWQRPFGVVGVSADRQVTPNLFGSNWLVQDTFSFELEATTFLEKLGQAGLAAMSEAEIAAFAGITFKRVYTYYHYANSYQEGLLSDFSKLFLQFTRFNLSGIRAMQHEEIMKREDQWSIRAGGLITTPPLYNISLSGGVLAERAFEQQVSLQSNLGKAQTDERLRLSLKSKKTTNIGATLGLQLDFFKLIQLSLLRYDLSYQYASAQEFTLGMNANQFQAIATSSREVGELKRILRGYGSIKYLEPYIVRLDESSSSSLNSNGSVLLWGRIQKSKTEQIRIIKNEAVKVFFKNYALSVRVVQNFFGRLFSAAVYKLFKLPMGVKNVAMYKRLITMEYEATHPQASDPKVARLEDSEQFSLVLTQSYEAARTDRWIDQKFKQDVIWFIDAFTTLTADYKTSVRQELLRGPMLIETNLRIGKEGFDYLLERPTDEVFQQLVFVCGSHRMRDWTRESSRQILLASLLIDNDACVSSLGKKYLSFKRDYLNHHLRPSLAKFKTFLAQYFKQAGNIKALTALFGASNTFMHGRLQAKTAGGNDFNTSFSAGQFRGLGVIDNFKRNSGTRMPASIVSED
jgi:hypothetical protein